jgi:hypothetical protein
MARPKLGNGGGIRKGNVEKTASRWIPGEQP